MGRAGQGRVVVPVHIMVFVLLFSYQPSPMSYRTIANIDPLACFCPQRHALSLPFRPRALFLVLFSFRRCRSNVGGGHKTRRLGCALVSVRVERDGLMMVMRVLGGTGRERSEEALWLTVVGEGMSKIKMWMMRIDEQDAASPLREKTLNRIYGVSEDIVSKNKVSVALSGQVVDTREAGARLVITTSMLD